MERLRLDDTIFDVARKLSEGNPGALQVLMSMLDRGATIDPDDFMGGMGALVHLDSFGIYGPRIWMLYKDVCGGKLADTIGLVRACQLGFVSREVLAHAIDHRGAGLDVAAALRQVRERLPRFGVEPREAVPAAAAQAD